MRYLPKTIITIPNKENHRCSIVRELLCAVRLSASAWSPFPYFPHAPSASVPETGLRTRNRIKEFNIYTPSLSGPPLYVLHTSAGQHTFLAYSPKSTPTLRSRF